MVFINTVVQKYEAALEHGPLLFTIQGYFCCTLLIGLDFLDENIQNL